MLRKVSMRITMSTRGISHGSATILEAPVGRSYVCVRRCLSRQNGGHKGVLLVVLLEFLNAVQFASLTTERFEEDVESNDPSN
jgi:hypothetical protein